MILQRTGRPSWTRDDDDRLADLRVQQYEAHGLDPANLLPVERQEPGLWETAEELRQRPIEPTPWVLPGLAVRGSLTLLFGDAKCGKSWLMLSAIDAAARRRPGLLREIGERGPIVYLSEEGRATMRPKVERWRSADLHLLYSRRARMNWEQAIETAARRVEETGAVCLVIDTWGEWTGLVGDAENQSGAARYLAPLAALAEEHGIAVVILHHGRKDATGPLVNRVRGTSALAAACDLIAMGSRPADAPEGVRQVEYAGRFDDLPDALRFSIDKATGALGHAALPGPFDAVIEALAAGPMTTKELSEALGCDIKTAKKKASAAALAGVVTSSGTGKKNDPTTWATANDGKSRDPRSFQDSHHPVIRPEAAEFDGLRPKNDGNGDSPNPGLFPGIEDVL